MSLTTTDPDDVIVLTVNIDDCPLSEVPLSEVFEMNTSTLLPDYLATFRSYITQQLEDTSWLDDQSMSPLFDAGFGTFLRKDNGDIISLRKPALQRLIIQSLRGRSDNLIPLAIPIFIRFMIPDSFRPIRSRNSAVPSVIGDIGSQVEPDNRDSTSLAHPSHVPPPPTFRGAPVNVSSVLDQNVGVTYPELEQNDTTGYERGNRGSTYNAQRIRDGGHTVSGGSLRT
jgi:hypothetical protein